MLTKKELIQIKTALNGMKKFRMHVDSRCFEDPDCIPFNSVLSLLEVFTETEEDKKHGKK